MVGSTESRAKIRSWFKKENREENISRGQELLATEIEKAGYKWKDVIGKDRLDKVGMYFNNMSEDDLLASVGFGGLASKSVALKLIDFYQEEIAVKNVVPKTLEEDVEKLKITNVKSRGGNGILVKGESGLDVHLAKCCNPVPGDEIIGYITRLHGVSVHRADCSNAIHFSDKAREISVKWESSTTGTFLVNIKVISYDRTALIADILAVFADMKMIISSANAKVDDNGMAIMKLGIQIKDLHQLDYIMTKIRRIKGVHSVYRSQSEGE